MMKLWLMLQNLQIQKLKLSPKRIEKLAKQMSFSNQAFPSSRVKKNT